MLRSLNKLIRFPFPTTRNVLAFILHLSDPTLRLRLTTLQALCLSLHILADIFAHWLSSWLIRLSRRRLARSESVRRVPSSFHIELSMRYRK